jgi:hypothetical protein
MRGDMGMCLAFKLPSRATIIIEGKRKIGAALAVPGFEQAKTKKVKEVEGEDPDEERGGKVRKFAGRVVHITLGVLGGTARPHGVSP